MSQTPLSQIISDCKEISKQIALDNPEIANQLNIAIANLEKLDANTRTDQVIDRSKKISEILAIAAKIIYDFCSSP